MVNKSINQSFFISYYLDYLPVPWEIFLLAFYKAPPSIFTHYLKENIHPERKYCIIFWVAASAQVIIITLLILSIFFVLEGS